MSITKNKKSNIIKDFGKNGKDSGSPNVQAAILTERIKNLNYEGTTGWNVGSEEIITDQQKGQISPGFDADLVCWNPDKKYIIQNIA